MDISELNSLYNESLTNDNTIMMGATVNTGFEWEAMDECKEKLHKNTRVIRDRGKIYFNITWSEYEKVQEMRSIDNVFIVADVRTFTFSQTDKEADLQLFKDAVHLNLSLNKALNAWKSASNFAGKLYPTMEEYIAAKKQKSPVKSETVETQDNRNRGQDPSESNENDILKYRVTCERTGKHTFESGEVARIIGGELQDKYHWLVDLSMYHLEIVCKLVDNELITHLRITQRSKHRRNIAWFGPTTLRATICYNLLRLARPHPGDIIIDPMCGGGSIPIEATLAYSHSYTLCGDNHPKAVNRTKSNIDASASGCNIDLVEWNASKLPFKDSYVDIVVTDMPFGKRSGKTADNRVLYKEFLLELGRILKVSSGRAVLLTYDKRSFNLALQAAGDLFWVTKTVGVNIGGLHAAVYVLKRTDTLHDCFKPRILKQYSYARGKASSSMKKRTN